MICKNCKKNISNTEKICPYCGTVQVILRDKNGNVIPMEQYNKGEKKKGQGGIPASEPDEEKVNKKKVSPIIPIAVIGAVAAATIGSGLFGGSSESSAKKETTAAVMETEMAEKEETEPETSPVQSEAETETVETKAETEETAKEATTVALELDEAVNWLKITCAGTPEYLLPESNTRYISEDEVKYFSAYDLRLARNEIFARRGRAFDDVELAAYFMDKPWYKATQSAKSFDYDGLNQYEKANVLMIQELEKNAKSLVWKERGDDWYGYDQDGNPIRGWIQNKGIYYYLEDDGRMRTGFLNQGNKEQVGPLVTGDGYLLLSDGSLFYGSIWVLDSTGEISDIFNDYNVTQSELKFMGLEEYVGCSMVSFKDNGTYEIWGME